MILLPPDFLLKELIGFNPLPMLSNAVGVSERSLRNYQDGKANPRPSTMEKIRDALDSKVEENNPQFTQDVFDLLDSYSKVDLRIGWGPFLDSINAGSYPEVLFPESQKILRKYAAYTETFAAKCRHDGFESATQYLAALELPREIYDDETLRMATSCNCIGPLSRILILKSLELYLYLISSVEAEGKKDLEEGNPINSGLIQFLPIKDGGSTLMPIQRFMLWVQEVFGSKAKMLAIINEGVGQRDLDPKDSERQIYRWFAGKVTPRIDSLIGFAKHLFPDPAYDDVDRWTTVVQIMIFQRIYNLLSLMINSPYFNGTEEDIIAIFGNYSTWLEQFRKKYSQ